MAFHYKPPHSKTWRIGYYDPLTKKNKSKSAKTRDEKEAKRIAKELTAKQHLKINTQNLISNPNRSIKLKDALDIYVIAKNVKPKTKTAYKIAIEHLISAAGDKPLYRFTKSDNILLQKHLNSLTTKRRGNGNYIPLSVNTRANYTRHLFSFFKWLTDNDYTSENIITKIKPANKIVEVISPSDLILIFNALEDHTEKRNKDLIKLKYFAAYRAEELLKATVDDFDFDNKILRIKNFKGNRIDEIPMVKDLYEHLKKMDLPQTGSITKIKYSGLRSIWRRIMATLGMTYNLHQLRKTRGTLLANFGVNPLFLHKFMRHENLKTTMDYYVRIDMKMMEKDINEKLK